MSPENIADAISAWVTTIHKGKAECQVWKARNLHQAINWRRIRGVAESYRREIFHNLPDEVLLKAARLLEKEGKVAIVDMGGSYVIKFAE